MTTKSDKLSDSPSTTVVYGLDEAGKPKGARFPATEDRESSSGCHGHEAAILPSLF